jgi:hypothetical protein
METKLLNSNFAFITNSFDMYSVNSINCSTIGGGKAGGIALLWNNCTVLVDIINSDFNYFDFLISSVTETTKWRATGIYGYPQQHNKTLTCKLISDLSDTNIHPQWLIFGDFNIMLSNDEKHGGNPIDHNVTSSFRNILSICDLQDLGFSGNKYTWTNKHPGESLILARLDRFLATTDWRNRFAKYTNHHLLRFKSDHNPILLDFSSNDNDRLGPKPPKLKRYEQVWTRNEDHINKVKSAWNASHGHLADRLNYTLNALHNWGSNIFGILPRKIKHTQNELMELQKLQGHHDNTQQILDKEKKLDKLLDGEEM